MKVLGLLFKGLLWILLFCLLLVLLTALAWWMQWPLATGLAILAGLVALLLAFLGLRRLHRWRNKRTFIRNMLEEQRLQQESSEQAGNDTLSTIWEEGINVLRHSPIRHRERLSYAQPWYLLIEHAGNPHHSHILDEFSTCVPPEKREAPLRWHFLRDEVILQPPLKRAENDNAWKEFLALMSAKARRIPLHGIIPLLSARQLLSLDGNSLRELGINLRQQIQQVLLTTERSVPIYVLVQDLESIPGIDALIERFPSREQDAPLGHLFELSATLPKDAGSTGAQAACKKFLACLDDDAATGNPPRGDELYALEQLRLLGTKLTIVIDSAMFSNPHMVSASLRGLFFCRTELSMKKEEKKEPETRLPSMEPGSAHSRNASEANATPLLRPAFLFELLSQVLPSEKLSVHPLNSRFSMYASTKVICMSAWLIFLLAVCGIMAASTVYQNQVLTASSVIESNVSNSRAINELYARMLNIKRLEKARKSWILPTFGQNLLLKVEQEMKHDFSLRAFDLIFNPMFGRFRTALTQKDISSPKAKREWSDTIQELRWLSDATSERLEGRSASRREAFYPLTRTNQVNWTSATGAIITSALDWTPSQEALQLLSSDLSNFLLLGLTRKDGNMMEVLMRRYNENHPADQVCLSRFWSHVPRGGDVDMCVPPIYTANGLAAVEDGFEDILSSTGDSPALDRIVDEFRLQYLHDYSAIWLKFINAFNAEWSNILQNESFSSYTGIKLLKLTPQLRLAKQLSVELKPLLNSEYKPSWMDDMPLLFSMIKVALSLQESNASWSETLSTLLASPDALKTLRSFTSNSAQLRQVLQGVNDLNSFFREFSTLLQDLNDPSKVLALAATHYGGAAYGDTATSVYTLARKNLNEALASVGGKQDTPAKSLLRGMLNLVLQGITVQASNEIQRAWENNVLGNPTYIYHPSDIDTIFGEKGVVQTFMETHLKPFITRRDSVIVPASWDGMSFPFTTDFLTALSRAEAIAMMPAKEQYNVLLRSQPTLVNIDAKERPNSTEITLKCQNRNQRHSNRNYPREEVFDFQPKQCGGVMLEIRFPSGTIRKDYVSFPEFLSTFQYGEQRMVPQDFPEGRELLANIGVRELSVRILPDNIATLLLENNNATPVLPDRITYTW